MDLKIKDVVDLLNVSETTIRRWLAEGKIPAYRINNQYRFSRIEIEDWVMRKKSEKGNNALFAANQSPNLKNQKGSHPGGNKQFSLYRAIHKGDVLINVPGETKDEVIRSTMKLIAKNMNLDPEVLTELLLDRERMHPTGLNHGIGIPHTRDFLLSSHHDVVTLVFPKKPLPYGSLDGKPVHTMFFLFASDDKHHLHLLAKIAHLSSLPATWDLLKTKPNKDAVLEYVKVWESSISGE